MQYRAAVLDGIDQACEGAQDIAEFEVWINEPTKKSLLPGVVEATNKLVDKCIHENFDYLWIVEADVVVPPGAFLRLFRPLADINVGFYPNHRDDLRLMAGYFKLGRQGNPPIVVSVSDVSILKGRVFTGMVCAGIGCALIHRRVFLAGLGFKYDPQLYTAKVGVHDQLFLYLAQWEYEFIAYLHGDVICGHLPEWPLEKLSATLEASP